MPLMAVKACDSRAMDRAAIEVASDAVWLALSLLPLAVALLGFYFWRRVCPLAGVGQLGRVLGRPGRRRVSERLERVYPLVQLGILVAALSWHRLDPTPVGLALFLAALALGAVVTGFIYTGKTWCNFFCPAGIVEKIITEPIHLREQPNAQCTPCTACKKSCPDIDLEQGYWKELDLRARRAAYTAFPGIVLGAYLLPVPPWALPLALCAAGGATFLLGLLLERLFVARLAQREMVRHRACVLSGFAGFATLFVLADLPGWLKAVALVVATLLLVRRWDRREEGYVKEKLARGLLARWSSDWGEPPARLADVYLIHSERQRQRETRLYAYKETLRDMIRDGVVSKNEVSLLGSLRAQLGIGDTEHGKAMADLSSEEKRLFDADYQGSVERRLMLEQLARDLEHLAQGGVPDEEALEKLRVERGVTPSDWQEALAALRAPGGALHERVREAGELAATLRRAQRRAGAERGSSRTVAYFHDLVEWRLADIARHLEALLTAAGERRAAAPDAPPPPGDDADARALIELTRDASPYLRAAAAHVLSRFDDAGAQVAVADATVDRHPLPRETAVRALVARGRLAPEMAARAIADEDPRVRAAVTRAGGSGFATLERDAALSALSTFEVMTFLHGVPLFAGLAPDDIEALSDVTREARFAPGNDLCVEGSAGRDVFVLVEGKTRAWVKAGADRRTLGEPGPGACIGEMAALDDAPRTATVTATTEVRALVLPGEAFKDLLESRPPIAREVLRVLSARLRGMIEKTVRTAS